MAHMLEASDTMFAAKKPAWHGLGVTVPDNLTTMEALKVSGLDWRVKKIPIQCSFNHKVTGEPLLAKSNEFFGVVRSSDLKILGTVKGDYQEFQNEEGFDFMDSVLGEFGKVRWNSAGSLKGGKLVWMLAEMTDLTYEVLHHDVIKNYVLFTTSHDGTTSAQAGHTEVRVECGNTRAMALAEMKRDGGYIKIRHKGDMKNKVEEAQRVLGLMSDQVREVKEINKWMAAQTVNGAYVRDFVDHFFPIKGEKNTTRSKNTQDEFVKLIDSGIGTQIPGVRGTRWGLLNAVTEYGNHHKGYKDMTASGGEGAAENKLFSIWYGEGKKMADEALAYLTDKKQKAPKVLAWPGA